MQRKKTATRRKREWFDDAAFWRDFYPYMFPETRFANTPAQIQKVLALTTPGGKTALDLCCGPGRCAIALAQAGFAVTGVDKTRWLLDKARARARAAKVKVAWIEMDMRDFVRPDAYDLALSMFTSFGYFDDKTQDMAVLRNIFASLRPGGVFLIDITGKERIAKVLQPTMAEVLPDGTLLVQRHEIYDDWTRLRNEWILLRNGRAKSYKFHHTLYSGQEMKDRLAQAGFADVQLYGTLDGDAYGPDALRLIAVARKRGTIAAI
ncbi:MAG: methyltransferase domain-containing protein [bacterium]|nr:methyltransferase domain-containing protein [bacterium]